MTYKIDTAIYLHGSSLVPDVISSLINVRPTRAWKRGDEIRAPDGVIKGHRKSGLWKLALHDNSFPEQKVLYDFLETCRLKNVALGEVEGVEAGYVDYYSVIKFDEAQGVSIVLNWEQKLSESLIWSRLSHQIKVEVTFN